MYSTNEPYLTDNFLSQMTARIFLNNVVKSNLYYLHL